MANSIFLGPQYTGTAADTPRAVEEKLNADFSTFFALNPALASAKQTLRLTYSSEYGQPDTIAVTQAKLNGMISALNTQANLSLTPVVLDVTRPAYGGITTDVANQLTNQLAAFAAVSPLAALGLSTTAVTRSVAFTANVTAATATSTLTASGLPAGLAINSGARTITGTTTVSAGSYPIVVTETLTGKWGSPKANNFTLVVT